MSAATIVAVVVLGGYFAGGFALWGYVEFIRARVSAKQSLPRPLAFFGLSAWAYAFSGRHRQANDRALTVLVLGWRIAILLLPVGVWAFFASAK